ncbi:hypothetical protein DERF_016696 [Dermatophagoides farinae]|uniref:Uncharacterized protein n=1 Tax=Dermatophagoides farinae TaxID=6954 RepID=A0A922HK63_DERFA|nr:hypothetical protein DERF_016696 [Dermatophagoides farinae]
MNEKQMLHYDSRIDYDDDYSTEGTEDRLGGLEWDIFNKSAIYIDLYASKFPIAHQLLDEQKKLSITL